MFVTTYVQNIVKRIKYVNVKTIENARLATDRFENKIKGTVVENWVKFWKNVFVDYKDVVIDVGKDMKERPVKALCTLSFLGSIVYCCKHNPNQVDFRDTFVSCENKLLLVHPSMQNPETTRHLKHIERCYNDRSIRRLNIGIASIIWTDYHSRSCSNYHSTCPHLQIQYSKFNERILDIGFLERWWILRYKMENYDINF